MNNRYVDTAGGAQARLETDSRLRIIVLGLIVRMPLGGLCWHHLQYVMGLARLGHDVYFVEDSGDNASCYNPLTYVTDNDPTYGLRFATRAFAGAGLSDRWAYYDAHTSRWLGPCADCMSRVCESADLLLNLSGVNPLRPWVMQVPARALVDTDPVFTQLDHLADPATRDLALQHTAFLSFGENVGYPRSAIPDDGLPWHATRQPIVLKAWSATPGPTRGRFTTVMQWSSYPAREYQGLRYGMKSDSFVPYANLPERVGPILELAVTGFPEAPPVLLQGKGWELRDPRGPTREPWTYQRYIRSSKAEFSVAKHGYVVSRSGWFSERSACYLASGRPVVTQETGFTDWLEHEGGVIPFSTPEEAAAGIEEVNNRYEFHCRAARAVAEEYFDARRVLPPMIEHAMYPAPAPAIE
jgi:hypothetical protein